MLVPKEDSEEDMSESTDHPIFRKIEEGTVTADDFNRLISEATPESLRDRVRRHTTRNVTDSHIDDEGHQKLKPPKFADRVQPKREKANNTQMHGQGKAAHRRSARTQKRNARKNRSVSENKKFNLTFDKVGYYNRLRNMLEERGWKAGKHFIIDNKNHILTVSPSVKFDEDLKQFLIDVGRAERIGLKMPDIFEDARRTIIPTRSIKLVTRYLVEEEAWEAEDLLHFLDKPWEWDEKFEAAKAWINERRTR